LQVRAEVILMMGDTYTELIACVEMSELTQPLLLYHFTNKDKEYRDKFVHYFNALFPPLEIFKWYLKSNIKTTIEFGEIFLNLCQPEDLTLMFDLSKNSTLNDYHEDIMTKLSWYKNMSKPEMKVREDILLRLFPERTLKTYFAKLTSAKRKAFRSHFDQHAQIKGGGTASDMCQHLQDIFELIAQP
jgi:hypothetical protein